MTDGSGPLATLRATVARLDDLHRPAGRDAIEIAPPGAGDEQDTAPFDPVEHAARFEELHDALVAVLAEVEQTEQNHRAGA